MDFVLLVKNSKILKMVSSFTQVSDEGNSCSLVRHYLLPARPGGTLQPNRNVYFYLTELEFLLLMCMCLGGRGREPSWQHQFISNILDSILHCSPGVSFSILSTIVESRRNFLVIMRNVFYWGIRKNAKMQEICVRRFSRHLRIDWKCITAVFRIWWHSHRFINLLNFVCRCTFNMFRAILQHVLGQPFTKCGSSVSITWLLLRHCYK